VPRWRHNGGLPRIAPLCEAAKKTAPLPVSGRFGQLARIARSQVATDNDSHNRYDERESQPQPVGLAAQSSPT
jgi:hypothetical protein